MTRGTIASNEASMKLHLLTAATLCGFTLVTSLFGAELKPYSRSGCSLVDDHFANEV